LLSIYVFYNGLARDTVTVTGLWGVLIIQ